MSIRAQHAFASSGSRPAFRNERALGAGDDWLLAVVDAGLIGVVCIAPYFFGGRHDLGRLVFVSFVALASAAWFVRQALRPATAWKDTAAFGLLLFAVGLLVLQIVPLPAAWIHWLAPRNADLLPLWRPNGGSDGILGLWGTVSLIPHETTKALAMLLAYSLLFIVVVQRIDDVGDARRVLKWVAVSAVLMALFGLIQYFTSNGRYFWFYEHPFRRTDVSVCGSFMNRNHFANFLVLGVGPLVSWLLESVRKNSLEKANRRIASPGPMPATPLILGTALAVVSFAILLSLSRGGTLALLTAVVIIGLTCAHGRLFDAKHLSIFVGMAVVVLGLLSLYGYDQVSLRLNTLTHGSLDAIDYQQGRRTIWKANLDAFRHGGLAGAGAGSHRMVYPVHLSESLPGEYTHAENGYLQIATETGIVGLTLLLSGLGLCLAWCLTSVRRARSELEQLCCVAVCAGLAASVIHSVVDFIWYIPACMSVTVVLAACAIRLAQIVQCEEQETKISQRFTNIRLAGLRWLTAMIVTASGVWIVCTYIGPAGASVHWERFQRVSVAHNDLSRQTLANLVANRGDAATTDRDRAAMLQAMMRHLERAVAWDPKFAAARLELATYQLHEFERRQRAAANSMDVAQIRDAALASQFKSEAELKSWLVRAFGKDCELLAAALSNAHAGLAQSPLDGDGYLLLAELSFIEGAGRNQVEAYLEQGLRVRPHDGDLLFEVGKQALVDGDMERAIELWKKCFKDPGPHQLKIVYLLAGRYPAALVTEIFQPEWHTLPQIWARYLEQRQPQDLAHLLAYARSVTERQVHEKTEIPPDTIWLQQALMYRDVKQPEAGLVCLERAYQCNPRDFEVRYALGQSLLQAGRLVEAEPHFRWCMARRPENKSISAALRQISEARQAKFEPRNATEPDIARAWSR